MIHFIKIILLSKKWSRRKKDSFQEKQRIDPFVIQHKKKDKYYPVETLKNLDLSLKLNIWFFEQLSSKDLDILRILFTNNIHTIINIEPPKFEQLKWPQFIHNLTFYYGMISPQMKVMKNFFVQTGIPRTLTSNFPSIPYKKGQK